MTEGHVSPLRGLNSPFTRLPTTSVVGYDMPSLRDLMRCFLGRCFLGRVFLPPRSSVISFAFFAFLYFRFFIGGSGPNSSTIATQMASMTLFASCAWRLLLFPKIENKSGAPRSVVA
jgi:hypothetical protein